MNYSKRWVGGLIFAALVAALVATPAFVSQVQGQQAPTTRPSRQGGRGPSLGTDMKAMGQAFDKIVAQYKDPAQTDSTLALLSTFETQALAAKTAIPPLINKLPADNRVRATIDYRQQMRALLRASLDLEDQIIAGDMDKAAATIATMQGMEKAGHTEFRQGG